MTKRTNLILAAVFLVVGLLSTANTVRLNTYIRETVPRDAAQEECNAKQIEVMQSWLQARANRDGAMNARDDATITVLDQIANGNPITPEQARSWRDAVAADRQVRADVAHNFETHPLPDC